MGRGFVPNSLRDDGQNKADMDNDIDVRAENQNLTGKKNQDSNCLQIDFSYLSNSGTGDLFVESLETDETQSIEAVETKSLSNHTKNTDDVNKSMAVVVPCSSP